MATGGGLGLGLGGGTASIAVGVAACGEPTGVGELVTFVVVEIVSVTLPHATTNRLSVAASTKRRVNVPPRRSSDDRTQAR
jgi:hypothetical protein